MKKQAMRDAFWDRIYELAKIDSDIVIVSADLGAPSLDKFRKELPNQYINVGISEQNAILVASGLALAGKKPLAYAITQFITLRCYEQTRIYPCGMNLPVSIVGVGAGACYWESGPTHHSIEDITIMRALPNINIYNCSDQNMARAIADFAVDCKGPKFIRLDREVICDLHENTSDYSHGFKSMSPLENVNILATGNMVKLALDVKEILMEKGIQIGVVDVFRLPVCVDEFLTTIKNTKTLVTLEEHTLAGGFGSYILEMLSDNELPIPVKRIGWDTSHGYEKCYNYGGREAIRGEFGMDRESIAKKVMELVKNR